MHICPIVIEPRGVVIATPAQLETLRNDDPDLYNAVFYSGDAARLLESFSLPALEVVDSVKNRQPFLLGKRYSKNDLRVENIGYHRQKTLIDIESGHTITGSFNASYMTFVGNGELIVGSDATAVFKGCIFDGITLKVLPQASVSLDDVEFSDGGSFGLILENGARVEGYSGVSFLDCRKEIKIALASRQLTGAVMDFDNATAMLEILERCIIEAILLDRDFHPSQRLLELRQPLRFINGAGKRLKFEVKQIQPEKDFILEGAFDLYADVTIQENSGQTVALSNCKGSLKLDDAKDTHIKETDFSDAKIEMIDASALFVNCTFTGSDGLLCYSSKAQFYNSKFTGTHKLIRFEKYKEDETVIRIAEPLPNEIIIEKCAITGSRSMFGESVPFLLHLKELRISQCQSLINLHQCEVHADKIDSANSEHLFALRQCTLTARNGSHINDLSPYHLTERCDANIGFGVIDMARITGVELTDSRVVLTEMRFNACETGIYAHKGHGEIRHLDCVFEGSRVKNIHIEYGNELLNLNDENLEVARA